MKMKRMTKAEMVRFRAALTSTVREAIEQQSIVERLMVFAAVLSKTRGYSVEGASRMVLDELAEALDTLAKGIRMTPPPQMVVVCPDDDPNTGPDPDLPPGDPPEVKIPALEDLKKGK